MAFQQLMKLKSLIATFDYSIFANQQNLTGPRQEEGQVGGSKIAANDTDMDPYTVFQRFCVLLLTIHGQVDNYNTDRCDGKSDRHLPDKTEFLKNLNVYQGIVQIDETIRQKNYTEE